LKPAVPLDEPPARSPSQSLSESAAAKAIAANSTATARRFAYTLIV